MSEYDHPIEDANNTAVKLFIGAALALALINALMYLSFRDIVFVYYIAYSLSFVAATMVIHSLDLNFDLPIQDRSYLFLSYHCMIIFLSLFVSTALQTKQFMPRVEIFLVFCRWLAVAMAVATLIDGRFFSYTLIAFFPVSVAMLGIITYAYFKGIPSANLLALGVGFFLIGVISSYMVNNALIPSNMITDRGQLIGSIAEMVLFSIALFRKVLTLNEDKHAANQALLMHSEQAKAVLESTVIERTKELNLAKLEAEQANHARGEFFATINHEMRTPLNGILGMIEVLYQQKDQTTSARHLKTLKSASQQLSSLINNVLDLSKIDHNTNLEVQTVDFNLLDLVDELEDIFVTMANDKDIELNLRITDTQTLGRQGDYAKLRQILVNLIGNAVKFTEHGSVNLEVSAGDKPDQLVFSVMDTGSRMEPEQLRNIFTAYHQLPRKDGHSYSGTGLGLAIAKNLTSVMGGTLNVESKLGQGTRFNLKLNLKSIDLQSSNNTDHQHPLKTVNLSDKCILVVDDSAINQQVVEAFLASSGITLIAVKDGQKAIDRYQQGDIDIVLMDFQMHPINGIVATRGIRDFETQHKIEHCPIILHTADTRPEVLQEANQAGADHCLYKPYTQIQLLSLICDFFEVEFNGDEIDTVDVKSEQLLINKFLDHCHTSFNQCTQHMEQHDFDALGQEIHQMLGSCGVFGATSMYDTLQQIETLLNQNQQEPAPIEQLLSTAKEQLQLYAQAAKL